MQFVEKSIRDMRAGRKDTTRRPKGENEALWFGCRSDPHKVISSPIPGEWDIPTIVILSLMGRLLRIKWQAGRRYSIRPGRGKLGIGDYLCGDLFEERLLDMTPLEVAREGYDHLGHFLVAWAEMYGDHGTWMGRGPPVWVIRMDQYAWLS